MVRIESGSFTFTLNREGFVIIAQMPISNGRKNPPSRISSEAVGRKNVSGMVKSGRDDVPMKEAALL